MRLMVPTAGRALLPVTTRRLAGRARSVPAGGAVLYDYITALELLRPARIVRLPAAGAARARGRLSDWWF